MRTAIDLELWGERLRILSDSPDAAALLRASLADHVISDDSPVGFVLKAPDAPRGLYHLIDRSGIVLARACSWRDCVAVLAEYLAGFAPSPAGTVRTAMRAVLRGGGEERTAILAAFPLLAIPPLVERRLERSGQQVLDRLAVDIDPTGVISLAELPWPVLRPEEPLGHCGTRASGARVDAVLIPNQSAGLNRPSLIASIASLMPGALPETALAIAEAFSERIRGIPLDDEVARRRALRTG